MKTKVLIIISSLLGGGAEKVLTNILKNIDYDKFSITLLLIFNEGGLIKELPKDVEILYLFKNQRNFFARLTSKFISAGSLYRKQKALNLLKGRNFDTIVSFLEGSVTLLHSQIMHLGRLNCSWVHCNFEQFRWYDRVMSLDKERSIYQKMDRIAFVSQGTKQSFEKIISTDAYKTVIPNPVCVTSALSEQPDTKRNDFFRIVSIGRFVPVKRFDRLLKTASILKSRNLKFQIDILGTGFLEKSLKEMAAQLNVDDVVNFLGFKQNPAPYIQNADVLCLTSDSEGFAMVVAEALLLGTPVVATKVNGVTEMLSWGGGVMTEFSAESIADNLEKIIKDKDYLKDLKEGTKIAARNLNLEHIIKTIETFITPEAPIRPEQ